MMALQCLCLYLVLFLFLLCFHPVYLFLYLSFLEIKTCTKVEHKIYQRIKKLQTNVEVSLLNPGQPYLKINHKIEDINAYRQLKNGTSTPPTLGDIGQFAQKIKVYFQPSTLVYSRVEGYHTKVEPLLYIGIDRCRKLYQGSYQSRDLLWYIIQWYIPQQ